MRHLMWILTWIAVGIGGALGAASVIMLNASRTSHPQGPDAVAGSGSKEQPVLVNKPKPGVSGRSQTYSHPRSMRVNDQLD